MIKFDCIFIHPVIRHRRSCYFTEIPMGFFSMADLLERNGLRCKILNLGTEYALNSQFSIQSYLTKNPTHAVAIDLHWYVHSYSAICLVKEIKSFDKNIKIILGGFTASFFYNEIMNSYPFIDFLIRGEGEIPLLHLLRNLNKAKFHDIPNLVWRDGNKFFASNQFIYTDDKTMETLKFSNLELLEHWESYISQCSASPIITYINIQKKIKNIFYLCIGRGCNFSCSDCGGSKESYELLNFRNEPYIRSINGIIEDIKELVKKGIENIYFEYDTQSNDENYFRKLFKKIRENKIIIGANFGVSSPVGAGFLSDFAETFDLNRSCLSFLPKSCSESIRNLNKSNAYTNDELIKTITIACEKKIPVSINLKIGLPGEAKEHFKETKEFFQRIKKFPIISTLSLPNTEPASPMLLYPDKYKIKVFRKTFADFYEAYKKYSQGKLPQHPVGYETNSFSERELINLKIKAYRLFSLRINYLLNRKNKSQKIRNILKGVKIFISIILGIPSFLLIEEKL